MPVKITTSARNDLSDDLPMARNLVAPITAMKRVSVFPDIKEGRKRPKGRERWDVEVDGLGNLEVDVEVPAKTHGMKDTDKRTKAVEAIVAEMVADQIAQMQADHAG